MSDITQLSDEYLLNAATHSEPEIRVSKGKRVVYATDNNQGSYRSGTINIDAQSQMTGANGFASIRDGYLVVPYVVSMKNTSTSDTWNDAVNRFCVALKCGVWNVIDSLSCELNGKTILTEGDYKLFMNNLRAQTEWSSADEKNAAEAFMYPDDWSSISFNSSNDTFRDGDGYTNNAMLPQGGLSFNGEDFQRPLNGGFLQRAMNNPPLVSYLDGTGKAIGGVNSYGWRTMRSGAAKTIAAQNAKGAFAVLPKYTTKLVNGVEQPNTDTATVDGVANVPINRGARPGDVAAVWVHMLKIKLADLHPLFKELDLLANPQLKLKLKFNAGYCDVKYTISTGLGGMSLEGTTLTSGKTCPIMLASGAAGHPMRNVVGTIDEKIQIAFGPLENSISPLASVSELMPFTTSRLYIPFYDIANPSAIVSKPVKKIKFLDCYAQYFTGKAGEGASESQHNASFNLQLSATKKNIKAVALIPFADTSKGHYFRDGINAEQFQSPFDSAPWTCQPGSSIRNFSCQIGNENVFTASHEYDYQSFCDEFSKLASINGNLSHEISNGLIGYDKWENAHRVLVADTSRISNPEVPQSILVSGTNTSCQGASLMVLVLYQRTLEIDRLTGEVLSYDS